MEDRYTVARHRMVEEQIRARGIKDERVIVAMGRVPREAFVPPDLAEFAYDDNPLPIAEGQTISQPYIVALMAEAGRMEPQSRVLEVGTGSGYAAAVLSELAAEVITIERHAALADSARSALRKLGVSNVDVISGDGSRGVPECDPFDAILVAAAANAPPDALKNQLAAGGRLIIPVGSSSHQELIVITRRDESFDTENLGPVRFVPLIGRVAG